MGMRLRLDPASAVPLYHQIVEALRYRIATGRLVSGDPLPAVRDAAEAWGVNLHTVRRAYRQLVSQGLVDSRPGRGTRVLGGPGGPGLRSGRLDAFLARVLEEARDGHGLAADDLAALLANWSGPSGAAASSAAVVWMLECSTNQCLGHAAELQARWDVDARPWSLDQPGKPPEGALVATYFHFNEIRRRWPERLHEVRFAAIRPAPELLAELRERAGSSGPVRVPLCELESTSAQNIAADVSALLPAREFRVVPTTVERPGELLTPRRRLPVLFSPRTWGALTEAERAHPAALEVRYAFPPEEVEAIGRHFRWARIPAAERLRERRRRLNV
jgi:GntR family transcriptional regulator